MADYTPEEMAQLKTLMAKGRLTKLKASSVFALGQKLKLPCKLRIRFTAGMTDRDKNEAFDNAMQKYINCLVSNLP